MSVIHVDDLTAESWFELSELTDSKDSLERWRRSAAIRFCFGEGMSAVMKVFTTYLSPRPVVDWAADDERSLCTPIVDTNGYRAARTHAMESVLDSIEKWEIEDRSLPGADSEGEESDTTLPLDDIRPGDWALHKSNSLDERPVFGVDYEQGLVWLGVRLDHMGRPTSIFGPMPTENYHFYRGNKL